MTETTADRRRRLAETALEQTAAARGEWIAQHRGEGPTPFFLEHPASSAAGASPSSPTPNYNPGVDGA